MDGAVAAKLFHLNFNILNMTINTFEIKYNASNHHFFLKPLQLLSNIMILNPLLLRMEYNTMLLW
jgi:hypothetical protein